MRVAVLMGGRSGEHEVSLRSGAAVLGALATLGHEPLAVTFGKFGGARVADLEDKPIGQGLVALEAWRPDVAFIAMHGPDGEDGRVQGALEMLGIAYQGSGVQASAVGLDKARTKMVFRTAGLPVAEDRVIGARADWDAIIAALGLPLVLKTPASGSSVGVAIVRDRLAFIGESEGMLSAVSSILVEQYVKGREFTAPVLEDVDGTPRALPIVEIRPKSAAFFDYGAKYTPGASDELCPAPIPPALEAELRRLALGAHVALGCSGYSRTDMMVGDDGRIALLETNTLPGLTGESLFPKSAAAAGFDFPALIQRLLDRAIAARRS